jgi:predicted aldo/keto reductase-like oxidoreductase
MKQVKFGKTNLSVSQIALGGIPIMRVLKDEAVNIIKKTIDLGINFIDTAHVYGDSEEKVGHALKGISREKIIISSKSPADDKKTFNQHLDLSLKRLGLDYIDIYHLHNVSTEGRRDKVLAPGGALEGLVESVRAGKVRFPAFSSHNLNLALELAQSGHFSSLQFPFNYIDHEAEETLIPLAKKLDLGFIAMKPMGGGRLSDAGLSFRYLLRFDSIVPDPGIQQLEEILEIVDIVKKNPPLSQNDLVTIEQLRKELGPSWCHRCDYCQPCQQDISISNVLGVESILKRFSLERSKLLIGSVIEKARTCLECGECLPRCPYNLDIPNLIKQNISLWDKTFPK